MRSHGRRRNSVPESEGLGHTLGGGARNRIGGGDDYNARRSSINVDGSPASFGVPLGKRRMRNDKSRHTPLQAMNSRGLTHVDTDSPGMTRPPIQHGRRAAEERSKIGDKDSRHPQALPGIGGGESVATEPRRRRREDNADGPKSQGKPSAVSATAPEMKAGAAVGRCYPRDFCSPLEFETCGLLSQHGATTRLMMGMGGFGGRGMVNRTMDPKENQDRGVAIYPFAGKHSQALFLCGDGHGEQGAYAAETACRLLAQALAGDPRVSDSTRYSHDEIKQGFVTCFEDVNKRLHKLPKLNNSSGGTTMTVILVCGRMLYSAWAGDSRAVIAKNLRRHTDLATDHKCDIPAEAERMRRAGGLVMTNEMNGVTRVCVSAGPGSDDVYTLNMSRSMGDKFFHDYGGVVATPDVIFHELSSDDRGLVIASDGVWEHVESADAADCVSDRFAQGGDASACTKAIMDLSMKRWKLNNPAYRDDITALVIDIPRLLRLTLGGGAGSKDEDTSNTTKEGKSVNVASSSKKRTEGRSPLYRTAAAYKPI